MNETYAILCLIFIVAILWLSTIVHTMKQQITHTEKLYDKLSDRFNNLSNQYYNRLNPLEKEIEANARTIEHIGNVNDNREKEFKEIIRTKEAEYIARLTSIIEMVRHRLEKEKAEDDNDMDEMPKYEWQFDIDPLHQPVTGESYIIVGRVKGSTVVELDDEIGHYGGNGKFYKLDGTPFEKVYAYIRTPQASDIRPQLFSLIKQDIRIGELKVNGNNSKTERED